MKNLNLKKNLNCSDEEAFKALKKLISTQSALKKAKLSFNEKTKSILIDHPKGEGTVSIHKKTAKSCTLEADLNLDISMLEKAALKALLTSAINKINV